nr:set domain-containing protein 7 [Quercus suber]
MAPETQDRLPLTRCPSLCLISNTPKGRGIFATAPIARGTILETSPILLLSPEENRQHVEKTALYHYTYNWPVPQTAAAGDSVGKTNNDNDNDNDNRARQPLAKSQALVLGLGSLFNHSRFGQNVVWTRDVQNALIVYRALRDVEAGEELCISYGDHLTFEDVDEDGLSSMLREIWL